jgi:hypothetical protein
LKKHLCVFVLAIRDSSMSSKFVCRRFLAVAVALSVSCQAFAQEEALPASPEIVERPVSVANVAERPLGKLFLNQWVQVRASGELVGSVVRLTGESYGPASDQHVLLMQDGRVIAEGRTESQGAFVFPNVAPGLYTVVARGTNSLGSFSINVLDLDAGRHLPAQLAIPVAEIADSYIDSILTSQSIPGRASVTAINTNADPLGRGRESNDGNYKVALEADGSLQGYLSRPGLAPASSGLGGTNVVLYESGREIKRAQADSNGHYVFADLTPGCYSVVASGTADFFACFAFCATAPESELSQTAQNGSNRFVSTAAQEGSSGLQAEGGQQPPATLGGTDWELVPDQAGFVPMAGGPVGGFPAGAGGGAGGGAGMFGGGFGGLAALGALGGIAAAIASDDDDNDNVQSPVVR